MLGTKTNYIDTLSIIKDALNHANGDDHLQKGLIFLTSYGQIQGKLASVKELDVSTGEALFEAIEGFKQDEERADIFSLTHSFLKHNIDKLKEELGSENAPQSSNQSEAIPLVNVKIREKNGEIVELPGMVLFADQIIGVIPGTWE